MKKINKKDLMYCAILIISFFIFCGIITSTGFLYGSEVDWSSQHVAFPEYFRQLYYSDHNLFPDFAFNIGSGQNIFNFSYYGLYNPIILLSYMLPMVNMTTYIIVSMVIICLLSSILMYFWIKKKGNSELVSFAGAFLFLFATCITFHSHRHIMFINYMPFLILGLYGVDLKLHKKTSWLLILSIFLMILTSYYFSVGGLVCLSIYGIYEYLRINNKLNIKQVIKNGLSFSYPFILGILSASCLLLPTISALSSGRADIATSVFWGDILLPRFNTGFYLYDSYGVGLTSIFLLGLIYIIKSKNKENKFLGITLLTLMVLGIFVYILNGFMYVDSKVLIPLLPLCILVEVYIINKILNKQINYKKLCLYAYALIALTFINYGIHITVLKLIIDIVITLIMIFIYNKTNIKHIFIIPILIIAFIASLLSSNADEYVIKSDYQKSYVNNKKVINKILDNDSSLFRINTYLGGYTNNNIYENIRCYLTTIYSSLSNQEYNKFYFDIFNNNMQSRNRSITSNNANILFNIYSGNKYLVSKSDTEFIGYKQLFKEDNLYVYENDDVLPLFYVSYNTLNESDYDKLLYPYNLDTLLNNVIVPNKGNSTYKSKIKQEAIKLNNFDFNGVKVVKSNNIYSFDIKDKTKKIYYKLDDNLVNKILIIRLELNDINYEEDMIVKINGNSNKLTKDGWKYHNGNYIMDYVVAVNNLDKLNISFSKGYYEIKNIDMYSLDYEYISNIKDNISELHLSKLESDMIRGEVQVKEDGYFVTSIPYDKGFVAGIDGWKVEIENVNKGYVGFPITKGYHQIILRYEAPYKETGLTISLLALCMSAIIVALERKK